jgi:D-sedoheptulose 7-phosphate isomerase
MLKDLEMENNEIFEAKSLKSYIVQYGVTLQEALASVDEGALNKASYAVRSTGNIYVCGNGGSAAIANHFACDFMKKGMAVHSLSANPSLITAFANDISYAHSFSEQLWALKPPKDSLLIAISSSGNSPNIIKVLEAARLMELTCMGLTGFNGGRVKELVDISLHISVRNYGIVEDAHQAIMHCLAQYSIIPSQAV